MDLRIAVIKVQGIMKIIYDGKCQVATKDGVESKGKMASQMDKSGSMAKMGRKPEATITSRITEIAGMVMAEKKKSGARVSNRPRLR